MTCADARHFILTASPASIRGRTDIAFRRHVEGCAHCATAAGQVVGDVDRLRAALIARGSRAAAPRRSRGRVVATLIPLALAAELALFAFLSNRDTVNPLLGDRKVIDDTVTTLLPVIQSEIDTGEVTRVAYEPPKHGVAAAVAPAADTTPDSDSLARAGQAAAASHQVQVTPTSRKEHVAVIATSNPKITVVWITRGDSL